MKVQVLIKQTLEKVIEVYVPDGTCTENDILDIVDEMFCNDRIQLTMDDYKGNYSIAKPLFEYLGKTDKYIALNNNEQCVLKKDI